MTIGTASPPPSGFPVRGGTPFAAWAVAQKPLRHQRALKLSNPALGRFWLNGRWLTSDFGTHVLGPVGGG